MRASADRTAESAAVNSSRRCSEVSALSSARARAVAFASAIRDWVRPKSHRFHESCAPAKPAS